MVDADPPFHGYVSVQSRGTIALPKALRDRLRLDQEGAQVELIERGDGVVEMRGVLPVPAEQRWFWTERWQRMEREADTQVSDGRTATFSDVEELLADLDEG